MAGVLDQEAAQLLNKRISLLNLGTVATPIEDDQFRSGDRLMVDLSRAHRRDVVLFPPND